MIKFSRRESSTETAFILVFEHPLGIRCSTGRIHTVLPVAQPKVFEGVLFGRRFWPRKWWRKEISGIKIGCAFFVTFFAQAKKVNTV
jgi:hypothetical protein